MAGKLTVHQGNRHPGMLVLRSLENQEREVLILVWKAGKERTEFWMAGKPPAHCQAIPPNKMET